MRSIMVLFTGGTVGGQVKNGMVSVSDNAAGKLIESFQLENKYNDLVFNTETLFNHLSENILYSHWDKIYKRICEICCNGYSGIIVTHGTDTLAYTSAFLSFMLGHIDIPILLVSSDYPLENEKTNGYKNFSAAVDFILKVGLRGVFVPYAKNGKTKIHLGSRLLQAQSLSHCFTSLGNIHFGEIKNGNFLFNDNKNNPRDRDLISPVKYNIPKIKNIKDIFCISSYPGLDYELFDFIKKPCAVLHSLYHSGTAHATNNKDKYSILKFAKKCIENKIDFYASPIDSHYTTYFTSKNMDDVGIRFMHDMSFEASYIKLLIAYGAFDDESDRVEFIERNIAFEKFYLI